MSRSEVFDAYVFDSKTVSETYYKNVYGKQHFGMVVKEVQVGTEPYKVSHHYVSLVGHAVNEGMYYFSGYLQTSKRYSDGDYYGKFQNVTYHNSKTGRTYSQFERAKEARIDVTF